MIVEMRGIRFSSEIAKPIEIHLESMRIDKSVNTCFTAVTEEGQVLVLYLPPGKSYTEIGWNK
jgi:hypothetical protein